jgi:NAD dependent epimerase/dehydratase family enzyme
MPLSGTTLGRYALRRKLAVGGMAEVLLDGQHAAPKKLLEAGFQFRFPALDAALRDLFA